MISTIENQINSDNTIIASQIIIIKTFMIISIPNTHIATSLEFFKVCTCIGRYLWCYSQYWYRVSSYSVAESSLFDKVWFALVSVNSIKVVLHGKSIRTRDLNHHISCSFTFNALTTKKKSLRVIRVDMGEIPIDQSRYRGGTLC